MNPHHCQSINHRKNGICTCYPPFISSRPWTRCDGTCFQRNFYQHSPSYIYHQISHSQVQPLSPRSFTCNPSFHYAFYEPSYFEKINTKHKIHDPSSNRVTVRRITPLHVDTNAAETYRTIHSELFDPTSASSHRIFQMNPTTDVYKKNYLNSNSQNIPSVPSKKCVNINNGIQVSSTSFITTVDDQNSFTSDDVSEKSSGYPMSHTRTLHDLSSPTMKIEQQKFDSTINNKLEEHSSDNPLSSIDKAERYEMHSINEESNSFQFLHHDIRQLTNDSPILPSSSSPPNIDNIKSNEMLVHSSRSNKSIPSLGKRRQKSSIDTSKSSLPLLNTRSTLDFGLLIHETST